MIRRRVFILTILTTLALTSCNLPRPDAAGETPGDPIGTAAAQTVAALSTQLQSKITLTPAVTLTTPPPVTPDTQQPPTATAATAVKPCDSAEFVTDVTIPDGTTFTPGQTFTKTWRLKNTGSCTWTNSYRVVFDSGVSLGAPASFNLPTSVPPDAVVDISVQMIAPDAEKEYQSNWKLQNPSGQTFGLGSDGQKSFWVKIKVSATAAPFAVTKVVMGADNAAYTGACPHNVGLSAAITTAAGGTVTFYWQDHNGNKSPAQEIIFDAAGTKTVNYSWAITANFDGSIAVYVDNPNHQTFQALPIKVTCQ